MRVLMLYPNMHGMNMLPSAVGLFISILKSHGHNVDLFDSTNWIIPEEQDFNSDKEKEKNLNVRPFDDSVLRSQIRTTDVYEDFEHKVNEFNPDLIAASVSEDIFPICIRLLKRIKPLGIPTILGGVFPTFAPVICLSYEEVNMVCIGEGELALPELCKRMETGKNIDNIPNIWIKNRSGIIKNPLGPPADINLNPLQNLSLFDESRFYRPMQGKVWKMLPVETHRGCPYLCTYCNSPSQSKLYHKENNTRYFRKKTFDAIKKELLYYKDTIGAEAFYFWADTLMAYTDNEFEEFVEMYSDIKLPFWCQAFPETINEYRIKKFMEVGLFRLASGVEHGNEQFRSKILKRKVKNSTMVENFKILNKLNLPFSVNNIMGFPTETRELAMDTIEINRFIDSDSANAYSFSPFHGTPLRKMAEELGYIDTLTIARSVTKPTLLKMPQFPPDSIEGLRRCFILYTKFPKDRWKDIESAEQFTPEGNRIWSLLRDECAEKYMKFNEN
ncbi:MAG: B12-binding domain-containing radical SAM protein [Candidatus Xenobiia bacterium LiM19]